MIEWHAVWYEMSMIEELDRIHGTHHYHTRIISYYT